MTDRYNIVKHDLENAYTVTKKDAKARLSTPSKPEWEDKWDNWFGKNEMVLGLVRHPHLLLEIKGFIRTLLSSQRSALAEEVGKLRFGTSDSLKEAIAHNALLDDVLTIINRPI